MNELITHYTNSFGIFGILKNGNLRLSEASLLNDWSELTYLAMAMERVTRNYAVDGVQNTSRAMHVFNDFDELKYLNDYIENWFGRSDTRRSRKSPFPEKQIYSASFSKIEDDLTQWRTYGTHGNCYSISFDREEIEGAVQNKGKNYRFGDCEYGANEQDLIAHKLNMRILETTYELSNSFPDWPPEYGPDGGEKAALAALIKKSNEMTSDIRGEYLRRVLFLKDVAFCSEQEVRISCVDYSGMSKKLPEEKVCVEASAAGFRSYLELDIKYLLQNSKVRIRIGPMEDQYSKIIAIRQLVTSLGYPMKNFEFEYSLIPAV